MHIALSPTESFLACCLVLTVGQLITSRVERLRRYSIPVPIVGGLLFALLAAALSRYVDLTVTVDTTMQSTLLLLFFCCIGLNADLRLIAKGGPRLIALLCVIAPFLVLQNAVGLGMAWLLDLPPLMGLFGGTITLVGGHGTGAAYANQYATAAGMQDILALAMTSATIGLMLGGLLGGPVGEWLIRRHALSGGGMPGRVDGEQADPHGKALAAPEDPLASETEMTTATATEAAAPPITPDAPAFIASLTAAFAALVTGLLIAEWVSGSALRIPDFLCCMVAGIVLRNGGAALGLRMNDRVNDILGTITLSLFLAMALMTLDLASVLRLAGPLALILIVQAVVCMAYAALVVFRVLRSDYEASVISAAFVGFSLGATATALANLQAVTRRHGPAPQAALVVPVTGAFLIDIMNALVLSVFISLPFVL